MIEKEKIQKIIEQIKIQFHPQKIIIFGSYAWGTPTEDSDLDLFLIMESNLRRDQRSRQVQKIFSDRTFPLDILIYTQYEVEQSLKRGDFFIKEILSEGKVFHG